MEKHEILRMVEPGVSQSVVAMELDWIEAFAASNRVPFEPWHRTQFVALGFVLGEDRVTEDGKVEFVEAMAPTGWTRRLDKERDWRVDLVDPAGRIRAVINYKPWDYAYTTFLSRYSTEVCDPFSKSPSAVRMRVWDHRAHASIRYSPTFDEGNYYLSRKRALNALEDYLATDFPDWQSPAAYWSKE